MISVTTSDGKYTFSVPDGDYRIHIDRYEDKDWLILEAGSKAIVGLMYELEEARIRLDQVTKR